MPKLFAPDWAAVRHDYENGLETTKNIVAAHGISMTTLLRRARTESWTRRRSDEDIQKSSIKRQRGPSAREKNKQLISRLLSAIERKLERIEGRLANAIEMTAADSEREARELGQLIRNFERLTTLDDQEKAGRARAGNGASVPKSKTVVSELNNDADRWRVELAQRIERLRRQWPADGAAR